MNLDNMQVEITPESLQRIADKLLDVYRKDVLSNCRIYGNDGDYANSVISSLYHTFVARVNRTLSTEFWGVRDLKTYITELELLRLQMLKRLLEQKGEYL